MPFDPRTREEIATTYLADLRARYTANGRTIDTAEASDARMKAEAMALVHEQYDAWGAQLDDEILPDKATFTLERHGGVEGMVREAAVAAVLELAVTGVPSATVTLTGVTLVDPETGDTWTVSVNADGTGTSLVLDGGGDGTAYATAQIAGAAGNRPDATILTWSSTPANANPGPTVAATTTPGSDEETDPEYAARILERRQDRPAGGNRADWREWTTAVPGCADAVVYPLLHPVYGTNTPGTVTVIALGPVQGTSPTNTRILSTDLCDQIAGYINGDNNADGSTTPTPEQLRPVGLSAGDVSIEPPLEQDQDVELQLVLGASAPAPWVYDPSYAVVTGSTTSVVKIAGDQTTILKVGGVCLPILVDIGTTAQRGGYVLIPTASISTVTYSSPNTLITLSIILDAAPVTSSVVLPGLPNWGAIQASMFAYFDGLGPGDTSPACRWPSEETRLRSKLYTSALAGSVVQTVDANARLLSGVAGVLAATLVTPVSDVQPSAKTLLTLGTLAAHV